MSRGRQFPVVIAVISIVIILAVIFCFTQLEIVPDKRWVGPSRDVRGNSFYALYKWLEESGRPVITLSQGNPDTLLNTPQKTIFIEASCIRWRSNPSLLIPWLEEGRQLIISLDMDIDNKLEEFLESLGIKAVTPTNEFFADDDEDGDMVDYSFIIEGDETEEQEKTPYFDWSVSFIRTDPDTPLKYHAGVINSGGKTKLVRLHIGKGALILTGKANFLKNNSLREKQNVNLAAELFLSGYAPEGESILFITQPGSERHIIGNLAERGNPTAMYISLCLLVIAGFWMSALSFGRYRPAAEKPGKPLRERFLAEGQFLKKNNALGKYISVYEKELEQRLRNKGIAGSPKTDSAAETLQDITFAQFLGRQKKLIEKLDSLNKERT